MENLSSNGRMFIFAGSLLSLLFGLIVIFDPTRITGLLGWEELSAVNLYMRGMFCVCLGCWFGMRSWRLLREDDDDPDAPAPRPRAVRKESEAE